MTLRYLALLGLCLLLAACVSTHDWAPTVDKANDPNLAALPTDMEQCRQLAIQAGRGSLTPRSHSSTLDSDGVFINDSSFRRAYINCLKERGHPVIN